MQNKQNKLPSGPKFPPIAYLIATLSPMSVPFDSLAFSLDMGHNYGDVSYMKFGPLHYYQLNTPELAHEMLVEKADKFYKSKETKRILGRLLGEGLFTSNGEFWKRQRKLAQPAFHYKRIETYAQNMTDLTLNMLDRWQAGTTVDVFHEMMQLTLAVVSKSLFDVDVSGTASHVGELVTAVLEAATERFKTAGSIRDHLPNKINRREKWAQRELDEIVYKMIAERRASGEDKGDLLSMLLMAADDNGGHMTDKQLRDEVMTIFLAGHETTALAMTWTWAFLSQHPEVEAKLMAELDSVLGGRTPTLRDLEQLPYTEMIIKETLRLYPPAPSFARDPLEDVEMGGYVIPKKAMVAVNVYSLHRDPRYFPNPNEFNPERFSKDAEAQIPRYAYLPFGAGPRICIGNTFAMMEARLILATVAQRFRPTLPAGATIEAEQLITIRPKGGLKMILAPREHISARKGQPEPVRA